MNNVNTFRKTVNIGNRSIGDGMPCFITFEAGPTHSGIESAKRLVTYSAEAGADAVKFQIIDPDRLVSDRNLPFEYDVLIDINSGKTETITESLYEILKRRTLTESEWCELKEHADSLGLAFFATVSFEDEIQLLERINCHSIKIASGDVNHFPLIRQAAKTGMCLQLDTGNSTLGEIEAAVDVIRSEGNENIIIHQCPSGYPARLESINLKVIQTLKQMFPYPVAFSDHTPGWEMDIAAVTIGANLVEKTITEDKTTRSIEHIMSLEKEEMISFIKLLRELEVAIGKPRRIMYDEELQKRIRIRRSVVLVQDVNTSDQLGSVCVEFSRPGDGLTPDLYEQYKSAYFARDLPKGTKLNLSDLSI